MAEQPFKLSRGETWGADRLVTQALQLVPVDSPEAGRLLCRYVSVLVIENGEYEAAQEVFTKALNIARREQDEALEMRILSSASEPDVQYLRLQGGLVKSLRAIELAQQADDPRTEVNARYFAGMSQLIMANLEGACQQAVAMLTPAERLRDNYLLAGAHYLNQTTSSLAGNWEEARNSNERGLAVSPKDLRLLFSRALLESEVGEIDQAFAYVDRFLEATGLSGPGPTFVSSWTALLTPLVARITGVMYKLDLAAEAAEAVVASSGGTPILSLMSRCGLAMQTVLRNDPPSAKEQYAALASAERIGVPASVMRTVRVVPSTFTPTARLQGLLARTMGDFDRAVVHFESSLNLCRRSGFRPELAWTCWDFADTLLERDGPDDRTKAESLLDESLAISIELGMRPLMECARSSRDTLRA